MPNDKPVTTKDTTRYYRADDYDSKQFCVVKELSWTKFVYIIAKCSSSDDADEIVEALNAKAN